MATPRKLMAFLAGLLLLVSVPLAVPAAAVHYTDCEASTTRVYCRAFVSRGSVPSNLRVRGVMSSFRYGDLKMQMIVYENGNVVWNESFGTCFNATSCDKTKFLPICKNGAVYDVYITFRSFKVGSSTLQESYDDWSQLRT